MPEGELEELITGNPRVNWCVIWDTSENCFLEKLSLAIERVWRRPGVCA